MTYSWSLGFLDLFNMILQIKWHIAWQLLCSIVILWDPSVDLVQLKEDAWSATMIIVIVLLCAWMPVLNIDVTHLAGRWGLSIVAVVDVLTTSRGETRCFVNCRMRGVKPGFASRRINS